MKTKTKVFANMEQFMRYFLPKTLEEDRKILKEVRKKRSIWRDENED